MAKTDLPPAPCPICSETIPQKLVVCPKCGGDLIAATRQPAQPASAAGIFFAVLGAILVALFLVVVAAAAFA